MAKRSVVVRNEKRKETVNKYWKKRQELKKASIDPKLSAKKRQEAQRKLAELPRNSNKIRVRNRCALTGRPRGVYKKFGICRHMICVLASQGQIPGLLMSSW